MRLPADICLRPISVADTPLLHRIYCSTREVELAQIHWTAEEKDEFLRQQFDLQHRHYQAHFPRADFYIVQFGRHDIGRLYLDQHGVQVRLIEIALLPQWRRRGMGSSLLRAVLAAADEDRKEIVLHVEANNPALALYRRLGFQVRANSGLYLNLSRPPQPSTHRNERVGSFCTTAGDVVSLYSS